MKKRYLMTPGPTPVPSEVLLSQAKPIIHHRTPEYTETLIEITRNLKEIFQTQNDLFVLASSGTGAMESAVTNLFSPGDKVLIPTNGKFGDRFVKIAETYALEVIELKYPWEKVVSPNEIKVHLEKDPQIKGVLVVQSETSTGILNDVQALGEIVRNYPAVLVVDAITALGAVEVRTDEWHLDVVMTGSQKGLMLPPGLAVVSVSPKAWQFLEKSTNPKFYFSWKKAKEAFNKPSPQNPFTPPISLIIALREALKLMREEGLKNVIKRHQVLAEATRAGVEALSLELFAPPEGRGNAVTPVKVPSGLDGKALLKIMKERYGITLAGGQNHLKGKIFRIGHLGYFDKFDILTTLAGLEMTLKELDYPVELGQGVAAAEQIFLRNQLKG